MKFDEKPKQTSTKFKFSLRFDIPHFSFIIYRDMDEVDAQTKMQNAKMIVSPLNNLLELLSIIQKQLSPQHYLVVKMSIQLTLFISKVALMLGNNSER